MLDTDDHKPTQRRETMLTIMLTGLGAGGFLLFLSLITIGFFFYVIVAVAAIAGLGFFHYLLWGYNMTQEVEEQQAQDAAVQRADANLDWRSNGIPHKRF